MLKRMSISFFLICASYCLLALAFPVQMAQKKAVAQKGGAAEKHYRLGVASLEAQQYDRAQAELEEALKLRPEFAEASEALGLVQARKGDLKLAVQLFR
ncbi:MAG TPA: tetratricopeptide repeat protein, partial [Pyrinomonadaceae bacterium]|nr:tetratricopeptide repeat protein [Pyrinomonadaceae bacterium]